ncbi:MAG: hypothetical protein IPQ07_08215 [Myxococcales bacterium]|nr:hypothetical protein [Myxococcales bacterium]
MRLLTACFLLAACSNPIPTPTGTVCPDPDPGDLTYENFGKPFMENYCTMCHLSTLPRSQRHGAPIYHDYDSLRGVLETPDHIDEQAGSGPDADNMLMPPDRCPSEPGGALNVSCKVPTEDERKHLALWIACERTRPHTF